MRRWIEMRVGMIAIGIAALAAGLLLGPRAATAVAIPEPDAIYYGTAAIDGVPLAAGTAPLLSLEIEPVDGAVTESLELRDAVVDDRPAVRE